MKSYKIAIPQKFEVSDKLGQLLVRNTQLHLPETVPGPQTTLSRSVSKIANKEFSAFDIRHEYKMRMVGRSLETGETFNSFIAVGEIKAFLATNKSVLLMSGKKNDILDFCRKSENSQNVAIQTIEIDMNALQEKLPEVRGVWFRFRKGLIRAKGFMGHQIQDTSEFCDARVDGEISTLSFYFEDTRDGCAHPVMITQDGAVVLQKNYSSLDEEIDFVMHVKRELLDGLYVEVEPTKAKAAVDARMMAH